MTLDTLGGIMREHCNADAFAADMVHRIEGGALIEGYNAAECYCGCGRVIEWKNVDISASGTCTVPDALQPTGFQCRCEYWCANECGDRALETCNACLKKATLA